MCICSPLTGSVLIFLVFLSLMTAVYICYIVQEVVLILFSFLLSLMTAMYICYPFTGSGSHIVIIPLPEDSCLYMFSFTGRDSGIVIPHS